MKPITIALICFLCFVLGAASLFVFLCFVLNKPRKSKSTKPHPKTEHDKKTDTGQKHSFLSRFGTMNLILVVIAVTLLVFVIVMIDLFKTYGTVPDTLITCVFLVCGTECGAMSWIKTTKDKMRQRQWELEDEKRMDEKALKYAEKHGGDDIGNGGSV